MITLALQKKAISYLSEKDPVLGKVIGQTPPPEWHFSDNYFISLVESIVSQQLSIKAADTIYSRFENLFENKQITPKAVLTLDTEAMRGAGLSYSKARYIKNLAEHVIKSPLMFEEFHSMENEAIIAELTKVKGIGRWTAEMFLIFTMGKEDIFSYGDLGLVNAIQRLYGFDKKPTREVMEKIVHVWIPYRSIASRYLWKSLEIKQK